MSNNQLLKTAEVAKQLNVSRDKVLQLIDEGKLRAMRLGPRTVRVFAESVDQLVAEARGGAL